MSTTTPKKGYTAPSPDGSDAIAEWPSIGYQSLLDVEDGEFVDVDSKTAADLFSDYPVGVTVMGTTAGNSNGWPTTTAATVVTIKRDTGGAVYQLYFTGTTLPAVQVRSSTATGWSPWYVFAGSMLPSAMATGQVTINGAAGVRSAIVMLPANRFTSTPRVAVWNNNSARPDVQLGCSMSDASATQFTAYVNRTDSLGASVGWSAIQGVE